MNIPRIHTTSITGWRSGIPSWQVLVNITLMALLVSALVAFQSPSGAPPRVHSALLLASEARPGTRVVVIVRHSGERAAVARAVATLGGRVVRELRFIDALMVEIRARDIVALGRVPGVTWVSPDAPMVQRACAGCVTAPPLLARR